MKRLTRLPYIDKERPGSSHSTIARWLGGLPVKSVILDVGCASGTIGRMCSGLHYIFKGIEPNVDWAEVARPFYEELSIRSIEATNDEFIEGADVVIFADVLEHITDFESALHRVINLQRSGCWIIISIPNIANVWVRLNLLFGRFEYGERGILDRTHMHFFTRSSFIKLLATCSLEIKKFHTTSIPLELVHPFFKLNFLGRFLYSVLDGITRFIPSLLGYQLMVLAEKV